MTMTQDSRPAAGRGGEVPGCRRRPRRGARTTGALVATLLLHAAAPAWSAAPPAPSVQPEQQNWLTRQIRKFRGYPHLDRAYRLIGQERLAEARAALEIYLTIDPDDSEARLSYAALLYRVKDYEAAVVAAEQVLQARPDLAGARITRALAQQALGRLAGAADDFGAVMRDASVPANDRVFAARSLADIAIARKAPDDALEALDVVARLDEKAAQDYGFQFRRAGVLRTLARLDEADAAYARALARADGHEERLEVLRLRGDLATRRGDFEASRALLGEALALAPDDASLLRAMADAESAAKQPAEAVRWLRRALAVRDDEDDRRFLAELLLLERDHAGAAEQYSVLLAGSRPPAERFRLLMSRGYAQHARRLYDDAILDFQAALAISAAPEALEALANARYAAGDRRGAADTLRALLRKRPTAANRLRLGNLLAELGDETEALRHLEVAAVRHGTHELHARLGHLHARQGDLPRALRHFERASALGADGEVDFALGVLNAELEHYDRAVRAFERALGNGLAEARRGEAWRQLGALHARAGRDAVATAAFRRALEGGETGWETRRALAYSLTRQGLHDAALEHFEAVARIRPGPESALDLALALKALDRGGEALSELQRAARQAERLSPEQQRLVFDELGHVHASRGERAAAATAWSRAQEIAPLPATALRLATVQRELGALGAAETALLAIAPDTLAPGMQAGWWEERAQLHAARGETAQAIAALETADRLAPSAERQFRIGQAQRAAGHSREAIGHFESAAARDPATGAYAETLAYVYKDAGRYEDAARLFMAALERQPRRPDLQQDLAYTWLRAGRRDKAADAFRRAIDMHYETASAPQLPGGGTEVRLQRLRQEVTELTRGDGFTVYQSYRPDDGDRAGDAGRGLLPSQGGLEYVHRLDRGGGALSPELFARVLWSAEAGRFAPDSDTLQGGIGARIKPLADHDFYLSAERLVKFGSQAREDWLLRASYGWSTGYGMRPGEASWNYTSVYLDAGHFTRGEGIAAYYAEVRQGWTFNYGDRLLITPHLTVSGRHLNPDEFDDGYREGGGGVSLRYLFNESRYEAARSSVEFLLQYKRGIGRDSDIGGSWVFTAVLRF